MWVRSLGQEDSPAEGNGNSLQYSCQENFMSCRVRHDWACTHKERSGIHSGSPHTPPQCYQRNPQGPSKCTSDHPPPPTSANKKERRGKEEKEEPEGEEVGCFPRGSPELRGTFWHVILGKCLRPSFPQLQTKDKYTRGWAKQKLPIFSSSWLTTMTFSRGSTRCLHHRAAVRWKEMSMAPGTQGCSSNTGCHSRPDSCLCSVLPSCFAKPTLAILWSQAASSTGIWAGGAPGGFLLLLLQPISGAIFISGHFCRADICLAQRKIVSATSSNKNDFLHAPFVYNCLSDHSHC